MAVKYLTLINEKYAKLGFKPYRWVVNPDLPPWQPLARPLVRCRLALIASGGIYVSGQIAFHFKDDTSFRAVPRTVNTEDLRVAHFAYDTTDTRRDPNVVFPIDVLRSLADEGVIGGLTEHSYTFMGGIYSSRRVVEDLAPMLTRSVLSEGADAALLVPV